MSRNIPVNEEMFNTFSSIKQAVGKLTDNKRMTNDKFLEMLIKDFSLKDKALTFITEESKTIKKLNDGHK